MITKTQVHARNFDDRKKCPTIDLVEKLYKNEDSFYDFVTLNLVVTMPNGQVHETEIFLDKFPTVKFSSITV